MNFQQRCIIPAARAELWDFLLDIPQMALCVPGAEAVTKVSEDKYHGRLRVKLGPIRLGLEGAVVFQERDREQWRATARSEASDRRVGGGARVSGEMRLLENGPSATELILSGEVRFLGKLGEFGEPLIRKKAEMLVAQFARNVTARFALLSAGAADSSELATSAPASSVSPAVSQVQQSAAVAIPSGKFRWVGAIAGAGLGIASVLAARTAYGRRLMPRGLSPVPRTALEMLVTAGLVWLGSKAERTLEREHSAGDGITRPTLNHMRRDGSVVNAGARPTS
jgi:carbon monoxide dehydrogenase subunit G